MPIETRPDAGLRPGATAEASEGDAMRAVHGVSTRRRPRWRAAVRTQHPASGRKMSYALLNRSV